MSHDGTKNSACPARRRYPQPAGDHAGYLKAKGFKPISVKTGAAALAQAGTADIDVVQIALHLEGISGFGVAGLD
jgi:DNA-binding response OmpR family regulator